MALLEMMGKRKGVSLGANDNKDPGRAGINPTAYETVGLPLTLTEQ